MKTEKPKGKTHCVLLLDASTSMCGKEKEVVMGYNEHVDEFQDKAEKLGLDVVCYLLIFSGNIREHHWGVDAKKLENITEKDYIPHGGTMLNDCLDYTIDKLIETTEPNNPDDAYLIVTITDGDDTSSRKCRRGSKGLAALERKIKRLEDTERWTFVMVGCDNRFLQDGIQTRDRASYTDGKVGTASAMSATAKSAGEYLNLRSRGMTRAKHFYGKEGVANLDKKE